MPTPDRIQGVVVPANGLVQIGYQATWQETVNNTALAAIFIGTNQLRIATTGVAAPAVQEVAGINAGAASIDKPLATGVGGLYTQTGNVTVYTGDVTTGQVLGQYGTTATYGGFGMTTVFVAAGTYDISIQFKSASGNVVAKNRKLWVAVLDFS